MWYLLRYLSIQCYRGNIMGKIRQYESWVSTILSIAMCVFVFGVYAKTVRINEKNILLYHTEHKRDVENFQKQLNTQAKGIANATAIGNAADEKATLSIDYNAEVKSIMLEVKTDLAGIKTDIEWLKKREQEKRGN